MSLQSLKINYQHKEILQAIVQAHFMRRAAERATSVKDMGHDPIRGKGKGLVMLLHGMPGVGKTATARAIALANGKPLFPITCGDLGLTPNEVGRALRGIFRLAHIWDCVLLLDDLDTFSLFTTMSKEDSLSKNPLASSKWPAYYRPAPDICP